MIDLIYKKDLVIMKNCTIYFIRHATPDWSRNDLSYYKNPSPPLTEQGESEAAQLGVYLRDMGIQYMLVSPLQRCQQTAKIAAKISGVSWSTEKLIREWHPNENESDVSSRIKEVLCDVKQYNGNGCKVGLVMHGGPIAVGLGLLGMEEREIASNRIYDHKNPLPPAGVWRAIRKGGNSEWEFELVFMPNH